MSGNALTKIRVLKRSGSDSGISNDSMDIKDNENAKPQAKPKIFKISISACGNSKRAVNGKELVLPKEDIISDEYCSSEEEGEILNSDSGSDSISVLADNQAQGKSADVTQNQDDNNERSTNKKQVATENVEKKSSMGFEIGLDVSDISDEEEWACRKYWERDVIDAEIIFSKNILFRCAALPPISSINPELGVPYNDFPMPVPVSAPSCSAIDDDVISLHPDDLNFDSNKNCLLTKGKGVRKQPCVNTPCLPGQESRKRQLPSVEQTIKDDLPPVSNGETVFLKPAQSMRPTTTGTNVLKRPSSDSCDTVVPNKQLATAASWKSPTPMVIDEMLPKPEHSVPSLFDVRVQLPPSCFAMPPPIINPPPPRFEPPPPLFEPPAKRLVEPLQYLTMNICWHYDRCKVPSCKKYHLFTADLFRGPAHMQVLAWTSMKARFCHKRPNIIRDIVRCVPAVLVETKHEELLMRILHDLMQLENVYSRDGAVRDIVFALLQIRSDGGRNDAVNFGTIIEHIFTTSHCYEPHTQQQSALCASILNLTIEQDDFMQYWTIIEKLFPYVVVTFSRGLVSGIVAACRTQQVSETIKKGVMHMLLEPRLVVQSEETLAFMRTIMSLPSFDDTLSLPGSSLHSESHAPCVERPSSSAEHLVDEFMECKTAEQIGAFLARNCAERYWRSMVLIVDKHLHKIGNSEVPVFLDLFKKVIRASILDEIDAQHQTLLMVLIVAVLIYLRENPVMSNTQYKIAASLIGYFENCLSDFHEIPVYNEKYKDNMQLLILSRLVHGGNFKLALRWMQTSKFRIPEMLTAESPDQSSKDFQWFHRIMKLLFDGLYHSKSLDDCKDLIILLYDNGFNEDAQRAFEKSENNANPWCMMDYFRAYVKETITDWHSNVRNILEDESVFRFYHHLHLQELRNVAILLYVKKPVGIAFSKLCAMIESFPEFYKFEDDFIIYSESYSIVEIQLVTHVFFYKFYRRNRVPCAVRAEYEEFKSGKACPPRVLTWSAWDTEATIQERVNFALKDFAPLPIRSFDGRFKISEVKLVLEQIRRRL